MHKLEDIRRQADSLLTSAVARIYRTGETPRPRQDMLPDAEQIQFANREVKAKLTFLARNAANYSREINSMEVEIQKKFSIPAACIAFVLIGAPLGSLARKGGFATGIGLSLFFFIIYWAFLIGGEQMADTGSLPAFWAMWLPNMILSVAGIILTVMFIRQSTVVSIVDRLRSVIPIRAFKPGKGK
jgi:lipopolysaccharide export system permease protein